MIFLSHSTKDAGRLRGLVAELEERDLDVWFAPKDIKPGDSVVEEMNRALDEADRLLVAWSAHAAESAFVLGELSSFHMKRPQPGGILFMLLDGTKVPTIFGDRLDFPSTGDDRRDADVIADWAAGRRERRVGRDDRKEPGEPEGRRDAGEPRARGARHALHEYPRGPMVDLHWLPDSLLDAYTSLLGARTDALAVINEAIRLRLDADADATHVRLGHLPSFDSGAYAFWQSAFFEACRHGPRMLAALLLAQPDEMFTHEARRDRAELLERLRASRFGAR